MTTRIRLRSRVAHVLALAWLAAQPAAAAPAEPAELVLARVELAGRAADITLPVHAWLADSAGQEYLLVIAPEPSVRAAGWPYRVLDRGAATNRYLLAYGRHAPGRATAAARVRVLLDDGRQWVVTDSSRARQALADGRFELAELSSTPLALRAPAHAGATAAMAATLAYSPLVAEMMAACTQTNLMTWLRRLSGPEAVIAGGHYAAIPTRHTTQAGLSRALLFAEEHFRALGLPVERRGWSRGGYSGINLIATQPGGARSNELVLVTAHLDGMPTGATAPGADDNASGSAAVLACAAAFRPYRFDRTVRYALFTGEEQGLYGSYVYAASAKASNDQITAVLNLDMIAWDQTGGPILELHTRTTGNAGYAADLAIASVFTNVVSTYGLSANLSPVLRPSGIQYSDHKSFWDQGWAAILAIEDDTSDFNAYYHTVNDTVNIVNAPYFTAFTKACAGTMAHLAMPAGRRPFDLVEVASGDWIVGSGLGAGRLHVAHESEATASGVDGRDSALSNAPPNPNPRWFTIRTEPYATPLARDARPPESDTLFRGLLAVASTNGQPVSGTNRLRFAFPVAPDTGRVYTARIRVDAGRTASGQAYDCVTNLRSLVAAGGWLTLPTLAAATGGTVYGSCEIGSRTLDTSPSSCVARIGWVNGQGLALSAPAQAGVTVADVIEKRTNLLAGTWENWRSYTNRVEPSADGFESGWEPLAYDLDAGSLTNAPAHFLRVRRRWLVP